LRQELGCQPTTIFLRLTARLDSRNSRLCPRMANGS
jgi:hypothetical protein